MEAGERLTKLAEEVGNASRANRELMENLVVAEVDKAATRLGFVRSEELQELRAEVAELRKSSGRRARRPAKPPGKRAPAKKAAMKKAARRPRRPDEPSRGRRRRRHPAADRRPGHRRRPAGLARPAVDPRWASTTTGSPRPTRRCTPRSTLRRAGPPELTPMTRLDLELVARGLARSRAQAQAMISAGRVTGGRGGGPPGRDPGGAAVRARGRADHYVSRGAHKLVGALDDLGLAVPAGPWTPAPPPAGSPRCCWSAAAGR